MEFLSPSKTERRKQLERAERLWDLLPEKPDGGDRPSLSDSPEKLSDKYEGLIVEAIAQSDARADNAAVVVQTIADLRALDVTLIPSGALILVSGYYAAGDGGGGLFRLDKSDTSTADDGGATIALASGPRAKAIFSDGRVNVRRFGARGNGSADDTVAIQSAVDFSAANRLTSSFPDGDYRTTGPITLGDNSRISGSAETWIRPDFSGDVDSYFHAVIRNKNLFSGAGSPPYTSVAALNKNISIERLKIKAANPSCNARGVLFCNVHDVFLSDVEIERTYGNWAFTFFCRDLRAFGLKVNDNQALYEDGIHVLGGEHMVFSGFNIRAGDDALAVGWDGTDVYCRDVTFGPGTVRSEKAFALKIFAPPSMTAGSTKQENIVYTGIVGEGGASRNGAVFFYEQGTPSGAIRNIQVVNCQFRANSAGASHDGTNPYGIWLLGTSNIRFTNVSVSGARANQLLCQQLQGPAEFRGCRFSPVADTNTETVAVYDSGASVVTLSGCAVESPWRRAARFQESDGVVLDCTLSAAVQPHVVLNTSGVGTRSFSVFRSVFSGASLQPVFSSGSSSAFLNFAAVENRFVSGSSISGISATNYRYFGNTGSSAADTFQSVSVSGSVSAGSLASGTLDVGSTGSGTVATFTGGVGGSPLMQLVRSGQPTVSFLPSVGLLVRDETNSRPLFRAAWGGSAVDFTFGNASASSPVDTYVYGERGSGTNVPSSNLWIVSGLGTGSGSTGSARVRIATPVPGSSGSSIQSFAERARFDENGTMLGPTLGGTYVKALRHGRATLVAGSVTVPDAQVTTSTRIMLSVRTSSGTPGFLDTGTRSAGVSFTISSSLGTDTSVIDWVAFEP